MLDLRTLAEKLKSGGSTVLRTQAGVPLAEVGVPQAVTGGSRLMAVERAQHTVPLHGEVGDGEQAVSKRHHRILQALFAVSALVALALAWVHFGETPPEAPLRRFSVRLPAPVGVVRQRTSVAISTVGRSVGMILKQRLNLNWSMR